MAHNKADFSQRHCAWKKMLQTGPMLFTIQLQSDACNQMILESLVFSGHARTNFVFLDAGALPASSQIRASLPFMTSRINNQIAQKANLVM
jgi:hypothetical protein